MWVARFGNNYSQLCSTYQFNWSLNSAIFTFSHFVFISFEKEERKICDTIDMLPHWALNNVSNEIFYLIHFFYFSFISTQLVPTNIKFWMTINFRLFNFRCFIWFVLYHITPTSNTHVFISLSLSSYTSLFSLSFKWFVFVFLCGYFSRMQQEKSTNKMTIDAMCSVANMVW